MESLRVHEKEIRQKLLDGASREFPNTCCEGYFDGIVRSDQFFQQQILFVLRTLLLLAEIVFCESGQLSIREEMALTD